MRWPARGMVWVGSGVFVIVFSFGWLNVIEVYTTAAKMSIVLRKVIDILRLGVYTLFMPKKNKATTISFSLPADVVRYIRERAMKDDRPLSYVMRRIMEREMAADATSEKEAEPAP
jgi:hypothetical protein